MKVGVCVLAHAALRALFFFSCTSSPLLELTSVWVCRRSLMSPQRQHLLDEVQELDGVSLKQANTVAFELCTNISFVSQLIIGAEGFEKSDISLDELIMQNECRLKVAAMRAPPKSTQRGASGRTEEE